MFGKTLGLTLCATLAVAQHIQYGPQVRLGGTTLTPAIDSGGNLILLLMNIALGFGPAPSLPVLLVGRYERDGSSRLVTDTGLAQQGNSPAFLALDDRDRVYVGVNRESQPVLARFGPGDARQQTTLFVPFTRLVAVRFAPNGDPVVLGSDIGAGTSTIQLVRLDAATLTPVARRLIAGLPVSPRALAVDRTGAVYVAGSAFARDLPLTPPSTAIGSADLGGAFVIKLSADLESIHYATVIGGRSPSGATAMEVAPDGSPYLAGYIVGGGGDNVFPTTPGAFQTRLPGERGLWSSRGIVTGPSAAFIARLSADGSSLLASTLLGGSVSDSMNGIAFDEEGSVIAHGSTSSQDFPATGLFQTRCGPDRGPWGN